MKAWGQGYPMHTTAKRKTAILSNLWGNDANLAPSEISVYWVYIDGIVMIVVTKLDI